MFLKQEMQTESKKRCTAICLIVDFDLKLISAHLKRDKLRQIFPATDDLSR